MMTHERYGMMAVLLACAALAATPMPGAAQGWIEPLPGRTDPGVVRTHSDIDVRVTGRVAEVVVEEWFENRGGGLGEGVYVYPMPGEAVFSNFSLYQGDEELRGETMDAERARQIYEEILRRRRDPALIELVGHGLIRARVFPIAAGESRKITLRYTQVLEPAGDALQFRYAGARPGFAGPVTPAAREVPVGRGGAAGASDGWPPTELTLRANADAFRDPFSPTHTLDVRRERGELVVRAPGGVRGDLSVFLPRAGGGIGITLATHRPVGEDGYFMLTLTPDRADGVGTPRDITAVVDVSGSMSGAKLRQTQAALRQLLGSLGPEDRFRLIAFSNRVEASGAGWSEATPAELERARSWVDKLTADGGTNIAGALEEALALESPADRLPIVVFLTDGLPSVGERDPERIADAASRQRGRHRVFAFGVGYDVNTYLLDRLGEAGRGSTEYVEPAEDVERAVSLLAAKITQPVLTDLAIADAPVELLELYPGELPDLFAGDELVLFGRYRETGSGPLSVRGLRSGASETFGARVAFAEEAAANDYIPRLWASRKLGELTREIRLHGSSPELVEAVRTTALRYGLLSEYTAYLVQEPGVVADGAPGRPLPAAVQNTGITVTGQGATGAGAVRASERARAQRSVASAADLAAAEREVLESVDAGGGAETRMVAGRLFRFEDGVWVEARRSETELDEVEVALYSPAFFDLMEALPELEAIVGALQPVTVRGRDVAIRLTEDGTESLTGREVARLVERFRAR